MQNPLTYQPGNNVPTLPPPQSHGYSADTQSHHSQYSNNSAATIQASNNPSHYDANLGLKRPSPLSLNPNINYSLSQPIYQTVTPVPPPTLPLAAIHKHNPVTTNPTRSSSITSPETKAYTSHAEDFDLDDWSSLLDDEFKFHELKRHKTDSSEIDFNHIKGELQKNLYNVNSHSKEYHVSSSSLKQVPGHPYLYYDEKHPLFPLTENAAF
jgi:hypothetical protein